MSSTDPLPSQDYPDCPECDSPFWVEGRRGKGPTHYRCHKCGPFRVTQ